MIDKQEEKIEQTKPFKLKLNGSFDNGIKINPETLPLEKFEQILDRFHKIVRFALKSDKELMSKVNFRYEKGSAAFISDLPMRVHETIQQEVRSIEDGNPLRFNEENIGAPLSDLIRLVGSVSDNATISLGDENTNYIEINKETKLEQLKDTVVEAETIVYGKIFSVGGKNPNIHLTLLEDEKSTFIIDVDVTQARDLANYLYEEKGFKVLAKYNLLLNRITSATFIELMPFSRVLDEEKLKKDIELGTEVWKGVDAVKWEKEQRGSAA